MTPSSPAGPSGPEPLRRPVPTVADALVFRAKTAVLRTLRRVRDRGHPGAVRHPRGTALAEAPVLAESRTPLWTGAGEGERALVLGKVHNLRRALRGVDGVEVPAGGVFGFWAHVGRATRRRGFVRGRELRQGCVIPSVGGGLCQLSNALYDAALRAGFEVVERHAHSMTVPGSAAAAGRDATVFWNYVDLRFRSPAPFRIEARMDSGTLVVRLRGPRHASAEAGPGDGGRRIALPALRVVSPALSASALPVHDCASCGMESCFRHEPPAPTRAVGRAAFLVDELWPEHDAYVRAAARPGDVLALPLDGARWGRPQYAWSTAGFARVRQSAWTALLRAGASRRLAAQGAARQRSLLLWAARMARAHAAALAWDVEHAVVSQALLPHLWRDGHLGGRTFDVLMTSLPLAALHERLDHAARLHPRSPTLADFRADPALVAAEAEALAAARRVVTPHAEVASLFAGRALRMDWEIPPAPGPRPGMTGGGRPRVVLPASTLGRKGAYELREAARGLGVEVAARGAVLEGADFWSGIPLAPPAPGDWLEGATTVALPAFVEHRPRRLLEAVARGVPVVASSACGVDGLPGVTVVPPGDARALRHALEEVLAARAG